MDSRINQIVKAIEALPPSQRDFCIANILEMLEDGFTSKDAAWEETLRREEAQDALKTLAVQVKKDIAAGQVTSFYDELEKR